MSELEELVVDALRADPTIAGLLATLDHGTPAVFVNAAPDDRSPRWDGRQLPYVVLSARRSWTATTPLNGTMQVTTVGEADDPVALQRAIANVLDGAFWHPSTEPDTVTRKYQEDEMPEIRDDSGHAIRARQAIYDLIAFVSPPVLATDILGRINAWSATALPAMQASPASWSMGEPAIYWRIVPPWQPIRQLQGPHDGGLDQWWGAGLRAHILAREQSTRVELMSRVAFALLAKGRWPEFRLAMPPSQSVSIDPTVDPLRDGQVTARIVFLYREVVAPAEPLDTVVGVDPAGNSLMEVPANG